MKHLTLLSKYQNEEKILRNGSNFAFQSVNLLNYHIHKIDLKKMENHT